MRPKTTTDEQRREQLRKANNKAYAKKTGKQIESVSGTDPKWEALKEKHKQWEGTRLEKSKVKPVFLTQSMKGMV